MSGTIFGKLKGLAMWEGCKQYPNMSIMLGMGSAYLAYYLLSVVKRPEVASGGRMGSFLSQHCPILTQRYWPTFWCIESKSQTILRSLIKSCPTLPYVKEFICMSDGGHVALDWLQNDEKSTHHQATRPTVLLLPGLTGSSVESYVIHLAQQALTQGYRVVVFNYRGNGGAELKTARTYNAANTEDLGEVIQHIKSQYPAAPLMAAGVSLGGLILTNYLAKERDQEPLVAAMTVSAAWNPFESAKILEKTINSFLFNRHLTDNLIQNVKRYEHLFKNDGALDLKKVYQCKTIREFDHHFTSRQFGYPGYKEYYVDATIHNKIQHINVPLLCLNAADDMFSPEHAIPLDEARNSRNVAIVQTSHGGHIGFLEGVLPRHTNYMDRVFGQYVNAVFQNLDQLRAVQAE